LPKEINVYNRALHRFPPNHPYLQEFSTKIRAITAGYIGESYTDRFLRQIDFPKNHAIYKDLYIQTGPESYLQIDTLIITQKYIVILEIKNIKGKIFFQKNPKQLVRELNGINATYKCPEQQIIRHFMKLHKLLSSLKIDIPIHNRIVFAFSSIHVVEPPEKVPVLMACDLPNHLYELNQLPDVITPYTFNKLTHFLTSNFCTFHPKPISQQFNFDWKTLSKGVFCPNCKIQLSQQKRCPKCRISRKTLYHWAIEEWFYLCKSTISNQECVQFLNLQNKHQATYILKSFELEPINSNKYRHYTFTSSFWITKESSITYK
jgi:hypothetical protein